MYKVFIDNKPIVFASKLKKINKYADSVIVNVSEIEQIDIPDYRLTLSKQITLIVLCRDPEKYIKQVFRDHELIEAAGGIVKRKNKFLFIERFGKWDLPKGKIETGEEPFEAAVREVEEECGISDVEIDEFLGITYHTHNYYGTPTLKKNWWYSMKYHGPKKLVPQTEEQITKAVWLKKEDFDMIAENTYSSIVEVLEGYEELMKKC